MDDRRINISRLRSFQFLDTRKPTTQGSGAFSCRGLGRRHFALSAECQCELEVTRSVFCFCSIATDVERSPLRCRCRTNRSCRLRLGWRALRSRCIPPHTLANDVADRIDGLGVSQIREHRGKSNAEGDKPILIEFHVLNPLVTPLAQMERGFSIKIIACIMLFVNIL